MSLCFLHFPFDSPQILAPVLDPAPPGTPVQLQGWRLACDDHGVRVALFPADGAEASGRIVELGAAAKARLDFAMAALGAGPVPVATPFGTVVAYAFAAADLPEERGEAPDIRSAEGQGRLAETLAEVMQHFGRRDAADMPALLYGISVRALGRSRGRTRSAPATIAEPYGRADVEPARMRLGYSRFFAVEEHWLRHRRFDGTMSDELERSVFTSGDAVVLLPWDPARDLVLLIEQFRAGPFARQDPRPWCLETVAGRCDRAEPPEATARREAREEAGLDIGRLARVGGYYSSPAILSEYLTTFVGEADLGAAGGTIHGLAEEHEDIRVHVVPLPAALAAIETGEIDTAPLILALLWLARNAPRLRAEWS